MAQSTKENVSDTNTWMRGLFMLLFAVAFKIAAILVLAVTILQFLFKLLSGNVNERLRAFGDGLGAYAAEIIRFLCYQTERKPYPFSEWPRPRGRRSVKAKA
ncbi:MAG: DUF4389 domain-containing protein [Rhodospirillales bacterium]|jgi:hypothetical protein|nr:DUF4389 domain-containing protein [Rhodospirillales bacterium]MDP6805941.1 DUF4389 domain-containing protein [Rhodospirillales bacterium]